MSGAAKMIRNFLTKESTWKTAKAVPDRLESRTSTSLKRSVNEKILENLPRVFLRKNPGAKSPKTKPTKENRKDA